MYDLIVIGAGAVGLYLAKEFQGKGNSVLILEKKNEPFLKLCSGLVSSRIFDFLSPDISRSEDYNNFFEKNFLGARIWIGNSVFDFKGNAWLFSREEFNRFLFKKAKEDGVEIRLGEEIVGIKEKDDFVEVFLSRGKSIKTKVLAGCDGLSSMVAKKAGFSSYKKPLFGVITHAKNQDKEIDLPELFFQKRFPGFFAWRIPRKNCVEWGLALEPEKKPKEKLEEFLKERMVDYGKFEAALIPTFPLKKITSRRIFLCGDSAGHIKPMTGGGLIYGFVAARLAAEIIKPQDPNLDFYEKAWREELMKEIRMGNFIRRCYSAPNFIKKAGLYYLKDRQGLHQDKPTSIF